MLDYLNNESCDLYVGCHVRAKGGARLRGCGFTEFLSGERCIGFCLDKAQLSGRPMQIQDCPRLQEVLVGESRLLFFFPPSCSLFFPLGISANAAYCWEWGFFCFVGGGGSFSPMIGWRQLGACVQWYQWHKNPTAFMSHTHQEITSWILTFTDAYALSHFV